MADQVANHHFDFGHACLHLLKVFASLHLDFLDFSTTFFVDRLEHLIREWSLNVALPCDLHLFVYLLLDLRWTGPRLNLVVVGGAFNNPLICLEFLDVLYTVAQ